MTWYYQITDGGSSIDVWDHTATAGDPPTTTRTLDQPRSRSNDQVVKDVMADEIDAAVDAGNIDRAVRIARDGSTDQIERGKP